MANLSKVEKAFLEESIIKKSDTKIPYIVVSNFPKLGLFTALRFLEWVSENPQGLSNPDAGSTGLNTSETVIQTP